MIGPQVRHHSTSSKCPNQPQLHQKDHCRKEENNQDHQSFDQTFKPKDMILSEDPHLDHPQEYNYENGGIDPHHHLNQNQIHHHRLEEFIENIISKHGLFQRQFGIEFLQKETTHIVIIE
jgi:hypothetical protein